MPATRRSLRIIDNVNQTQNEQPLKRISVKLQKLGAETKENLKVNRIGRKSKSSFSDSDVQNNSQSIEVDDSDLSSDEEDAVEKLQRRRLEIEKHKLEVIQKLNLHQAAFELKASINIKKKVAARSKLPARFTSEEVKHEPVRKSLRIQNIQASEASEHVIHTMEHTYEEERKPVGEYEMVSIGFEEDTEAELSKDDYLTFMKSFSDMKPTLSSKPHSDSTIKHIKKLKVIASAGCAVKKVVMKRIFSMAFYPGCERLLLAVGCKTGTVGFYNMQNPDKNEGVYLFPTHTRPVRNLKFCPSHPNMLYTCSYDGILRASDMTSGMYKEAVIDNQENPPTAFDFQSLSGDVILSGSYDGSVVVTDTRIREKTVNTFEAHSKNIKCVSVHPVKREYFATCGNDTKLKIFDMRTVTSNHSKALAVVHEHGKSIDSAFFSPLTGNKILTTSLDDRLRIYNTSEMTASAIRMQTSARHNNFTGRWLSNFQASWHPAREDLIIVGSMARPRQIEILDENLNCVIPISDPDLSCVCSLNCFHPTQDVISGGNSGGRVFTFGL
uniref:WD repeat-containing protein 76 n=1 Tax=Phallusia mammillata TaxID=59560 RepID=A0A6F9DW96_9ASCI|nr:WD repeat-containing protein 76 [Phallusia mammillata]